MRGEAMRRRGTVAENEQDKFTFQRRLRTEDRLCQVMGADGSDGSDGTKGCEF